VFHFYFSRVLAISPSAMSTYPKLLEKRIKKQSDRDVLRNADFSSSSSSGLLRWLRPHEQFRESKYCDAAMTL
jgi:hypothetical protein